MTDAKAREELTALREAIDRQDLKLIEVIRERLDLVARAAKVKAELGEGSRSLSREDFLLSDRARLAAAHHLPEGLIEDLLKRLLRESYKESGERHFACSFLKEHPGQTVKPVVLVGGKGGMARIFRQYFEASGYPVRIFGHHDYAKARELLKGALAVMVCVPIDVTEEVIATLSPYLDKETILTDITSVKGPIVKKMLACHKGPVLGLHPMFGPDIRGLVKQVIVNAGGRDTEKSAFLLEQFRLWGAKVVDCDPEEHDKAMSIIQALRHFTTYCYGLFLARVHPDLRSILALSSPIYHLELLMVGRLFAQDPRLYADIIMASERNAELIGSYLECIREELDTVRRKDYAAFKERFLEARAYFGDSAESFLKESGALLARVNDDRR